MARKNKRAKAEYHQGLDFDPKKYTTAATPPESLAPSPLTQQDAEHESIAHRHPNRTPQRGDIWFASLGSHVNSCVQDGIRPVVIISNNIGNAHAETVNIVPMTRHLKKLELPCHTKIYPSNVSDVQQALDLSMVLAEQLTTISKHSLRSYAGHITDSSAMERIENAVTAQLGLNTSDERSTAECL
jgi:mRNA interferase MazF